MAKAPRFETLAPDMALDDGARIVLRGLLDAVLSEAAAALRTQDVEAVHDMRVAIRRLRSALETFEGALPSRLLRPHAGTTRRLGRRLGRVRDADVHLAALRKALGGAALDETPGIVYALETIRARRRRDLARFAAALSAFDHAGFAIVLGVRNPTIRLVCPTLGERVRRTIAKHLRRFRKRGNPAVEGAAAEALHALRIEEKRLRYNLEFFRTLLAAQADNALDLLTELQDRLGAIADADTFTTVYEALLKPLDSGDPRRIGLAARIQANATDRAHALEALRKLWQGDGKKPYSERLRLEVRRSLGALVSRVRNGMTQSRSDFLSQRGATSAE